MTEHKHAEELRAIADGKEVEGYFLGIWKEANDEYNPLNFPNTVWRIKPQVLRYRVALMGSKSARWLTMIVDSTYNIETHDNFIEWIHDDWQEVEIN